MFSCKSSSFDVKGEIKFMENEVPSSFPKDTWLTVKVEDVSLMDVSSVVLGTYEEEIKDFSPSKTLCYVVKGIEPKDAVVITVSSISVGII